MDKDQGLYTKYDVTNLETGQLVHDCFVLRPDRDIAARDAILAYADATENTHLADDLRAWIDRLEHRTAQP